ncbi:TonB-dependent receptor [Paucibacter sp. PLA-PC-4]|uniref:TonB-dependent receptor plug domain-containing protein n=1 Tax=Paucibacter sp. PLA-PC-4 TaxID=2993655 RepID=UPI00224B3345|nr:TonB-dependent receptor [Paucibacter sp. PLA-PC-4]MCX2865052.1 TonB-dependent receptor [Paucibacter sp. PLA-PC-4]
MTRSWFKHGAWLFLLLHGAPWAQPVPAAPAKAASAAAVSTMPRVELSGAADNGEGARRHESIAKAIYGREELDRQGDIDVTDVLKRLPGVSMDNGAPRLRGLGGGYTQVLINGEPAPPGFSLDSLAPADVERIEVLKGATAEFSGVAGTINVVLREPPRSLQREWRSSINYRAVQPGGSTALQWGDRVGGLSYVLPLTLSRTAQGSDSLTERSSRSRSGELQSQTMAARDENRSGSAQLAPRLQWKLGEFDTFNLGAFVQRVESRNEGARSYASLLGTPWATVADASQGRSRSEVLRLNGQWQHRLAEGGKIELKSSWHDTEREGLGRYTARGRDGGERVQRETLVAFGETRGALGARLNLPVGQAHSLAMGLDHETRRREELRRVWDFGIERLDSATGRPFSADIERSALFLQDEWVIGPQWSLLPGLRLERLRTRSSDGSHEIDNRTQVSAPTLHLNFRFDPKGRDQIRASLTRSFKPPDLALLAGRYVLNGNYERDVSNTPIAADRAGNPRLRPELASGLDLAFEHYPAGGGVLSVGVFFRRIDQLIRQRIALEDAPAPDVVNVPRWVSRPVNLGRALSRGLELEIKGAAEHWLPTWFERDSGVQLRGAWNVYRSRVEQVEGPDNRLEAQPPWSANLGFDARLGRSGWNVGASLVLQPSYTTRQTDRQQVRRSGLRTLDAFANWRLDRSSQLRIGVVNLLAPDSSSASSVEDLDGFFAESSSRRETLRAVSASWVVRY